MHLYAVIFILSTVTCAVIRWYVLDLKYILMLRSFICLRKRVSPKFCVRCFHGTTRRNIPEHTLRHTRRHENLQSYLALKERWIKPVNVETSHAEPRVVDGSVQRIVSWRPAAVLFLYVSPLPDGGVPSFPELLGRML
jgi:hypothetical protein